VDPQECQSLPGILGKTPERTGKELALGSKRNIILPKATKFIEKNRNLAVDSLIPIQI
jgi:hypothetical protein